MEEAGTPEYQILKENLSKSLYWNQYAVVKTADRKLRRICVRRGMCHFTNIIQFALRIHDVRSTR